VNKGEKRKGRAPDVGTLPSLCPYNWQARRPPTSWQLKSSSQQSRLVTHFAPDGEQAQVPLEQLPLQH
jgi:hypothetical protein